MMARGQGTNGGSPAAAPTDRVAGALVAGFTALVVAMGVGRFLYTPLLPPMLVEYGLRTDQAGLLASCNYVGYLAGAFSAGSLCARFRDYRVLTAGLILSCLSTAATGLGTGFAWVGATRFVAGIASALVFVAVSGLVLLILTRSGREHLAGLYYGGVGGGIVVTGLAGPLAAHLVGVSGSWIVFGLVSAALSVGVLCFPWRLDGIGTAGAAAPVSLPRDPRFRRLVAAYGLQGFGYIITGTFMVAAATAAVGPAGARGAWVVAGCAVLPSAFCWSLAARRWGRMKPLAAAYFLQSVGTALTALVPGLPALVTGAVLYGATFMGIVTLALSEGASYAPAARARVVGFMTGVYGIGQILGPALAGYFSAHTGSFRLALCLAATTVAAAGALLIPDALARAGHPKGA